MSLASAKKLLLTAGGTADPFVLSGSWEPSLEGWSVNNGAARGNLNGTEFQPRTGSFAIIGGGDAYQVSRTFAKEAVEGLVLRPSVWHRKVGELAVSRRSIEISVGGAAFQTLATVQDGSAQFAQLSAEIRIPRGAGAVVRFASDNSNSMFDDWRVEGART